MNKEIITRCIEWNKQRYNQEFDYTLSVNLLTEEMKELVEAKTTIDKLDAIGDIAFVTIGVMWKLGLTEKQIKKFLFTKKMPYFTYEELNNWRMSFPTIVSNKTGITHIPIFVISSYFLFISIREVQRLNMQKYYYQIIQAICNSNDTKEVKGKTPAFIKANIVKGINYVPPTKELEELYFNYLTTKGK